jgi:competence protein ComEC
VHRAPLLAPAIAALLAVIAEQHGAAQAALAIALACSVTYFFGKPGWTTLTLRALTVAIAGGLIISAARGHPTIVETERATARYAATVTGDVRTDDSGTRSTALTLDGIGTVRATFRERIAAGERVVVRGRLEPFDEPRNPGEPSLREIERDDGYAGRLAGVRIVSHSAPDPWDTRAWAARLRATASARIRANVPEPPATILAGALWGERGTLPADLHDAFQATGTVHVLVTAGLHLGIIAALVAFGLARLGVHRIAACAASFVAIVSYAWVSGAHLPSERAATMIGIALLARACGARAASWNALAIAAVIVTVLWPAAAGSASFALSFSCVAAILLFAEPLAVWLERVPLPERVREALALTCATQIGTWPLTAAVFSTLAPYAILANAVVVPAIGLVLPGGIATLAVPAVAPLETLVLRGIEVVVRTIAVLPHAQATIAIPPPAAIAVYDIIAIGSAVALRTGRRFAAVGLLVAASAAVTLPSIVRFPHGLEITHLDVGQADAAVIRTPSGRIVLIDTGGELERGNGARSNAERAGERIVLAYLRRAGIRRIDLMILTHPHGDHVGSARPIIDAMPVKMIFDSGQTYSGRAYRDAMEGARIHAFPVVIARRGMHWNTDDGVTLDILAPSTPFLVDTGDDVNENSIVTRLTYNDGSRTFRELFMGDAGEASEARLLASGAHLYADVLKVGHHGSRYASTRAFIAAVSPRVAIISDGRHNTFGHPAPTTLEALMAYGGKVYRTDLCGAIESATGTPTTMLPCML